MTAAWANSFKRLLRQPSFVVAVLVLGVAAVSLNAATQFMQLYFKKLPVPLAKPLESLPSTLGPWVQVREEKPDKDTEEILATDKYIFRDYVDTRLIDAAMIAKFDGKTRDERRELLAKLQSDHPDAVINVAVTYYTGLVDTVAHIPDRCYIADGYQPSEYETVNWPVAHRKPVEVRFINFEDQAGMSRVPRSVAYFFQVNGAYESDPLRVRLHMQSLTQKHAYYAKVELMTLLRDREKSASLMTDFLSQSLPEVEKCLPDWDQVRRAG